MIDSVSRAAGLGLVLAVLAACGDDTSGSGGAGAGATGSATSSSAGSNGASSSATATPSSSAGDGGSSGEGGATGGSSGEGGAPAVPCVPPPRRVAAGDDFTCAIGDDRGGACRGGAFGATWQPIAVDGEDASTCLDQIVAEGSAVCAHVTPGEDCPQEGWYCFTPPDEGWTRQVGLDDATWVAITDDGICFVDDGGGTDCTGPSAPPDLAASVPLGSIAGGPRDACAWSEQGIVCWGDTPSIASDAPAFPGCVADIDVGPGFACVTYTSFDIVDCWGELPRDISPRMFLPAPGVDVAVGEGSLCVNTAIGLVRCWGDNTRGTLGIEGVDSSAGGVEPAWPEPAPEVVAIAAGAVHVATVTTDGAVLAWGANDASQICDCESTVTTPADASYPEP